MPDSARPEALFIMGERTRERLVSAEACPALGRHGMLLAGLSDAVPPYRVVRDPARHWEIQACFGGRGRVWLDESWQDFLPGQAFLTRRGALQAFHAGPGAHLRMAWVHYEREPAGFANGSHPEVSLVDVDPEPLRMAITALHRELVAASDPLLLTHLAEWVHLCIGRLTQTERLDPRIHELLLKVDADLGAAWDLERLARAARISGEHLRRLFKRHFGQSPMERVAWLRMQRAAALLRNGAHKTDAIAAEVGYADVYAFSAAFKRVMGSPPSHYRP
jgi:AraC-like DNA-binding protein